MKNINRKEEIIELSIGEAEMAMAQLRVELNDLFNEGESLHLWVGCLDRGGMGYGSFKSIRRGWLIGRRYTLKKDFRGKLMLLMTDTLFDKESWRWKWPLNPCGRRHLRKKVPWNVRLWYMGG